jgi:DNA integrity scanning protein DisA with diadenylate cyclase activity
LHYFLLKLNLVSHNVKNYNLPLEQISLNISIEFITKYQSWRKSLQLSMILCPSPKYNPSCLTSDYKQTRRMNIILCPHYIFSHYLQPYTVLFLLQDFLTSTVFKIIIILPLRSSNFKISQTISNDTTLPLHCLRTITKSQLFHKYKFESA